MGLSGNPYKAVEILCNKDKFREFLKDNNFYTPNAKGYSNIKDAEKDILNGKFKMPVIVKPVDSSGSKGVAKIEHNFEITDKLQNAVSFSKSNRIIVEEFVEKYGYQIAGDGLSIDGHLVFRCFANDHFNSQCVNPFVPISASFPYNMPSNVQNSIHSEIQRLLTLLNMKTCTYNFDIRIDKNFNVYLMEVAPRDGGNYIPQIIKFSTGIDLVEYSVKAAMGEEIAVCDVPAPNGFWSYYAVHSLENGILDSIQIDSKVEKNNIIEKHLLKKSGDEIVAFSGANTTLGILLMKFDNMNQMLDMMDNSDKWIKVVLKKNV